MDRIPFTSADPQTIDAAVTTWLNNPATTLYGGWPEGHIPPDVVTSLGQWLVTTCREEAGLDDTGLVFDAVTLAISTPFGLSGTFPFDCYDKRSMQLFAFDLFRDGADHGEVLFWDSSILARGQLTLVATYDGEDDEHTVTLPPITLTPAGISDAVTDKNVVGAVAALSAELIRVLLHLHNHRGLLPPEVTTTPALMGENE